MDGHIVPWPWETETPQKHTFRSICNLPFCPPACSWQILNFHSSKRNTNWLAHAKGKQRGRGRKEGREGPAALGAAGFLPRDHLLPLTSPVPEHWKSKVEWETKDFRREGGRQGQMDGQRLPVWERSESMKEHMNERHPTLRYMRSRKETELQLQKKLLFLQLLLLLAFSFLFLFEYFHQTFIMT